MDDLESSKPRSIVAYLAIAMLFLLISFTFARTRSFGYELFWDGRVYADAVSAYLHGGNAYSLTVPGLLFIGPPFFLIGASFLSKFFPGHSGWYLYTSLVVISTLAIPFLLARFYLRAKWMSPVLAIAIFTFQPRFIVERSMISGNVVLPIYALALLAGANGIKRNRWSWFYLVIFIAGIIKPPLLALLLLPVLAGARQFVRAAGVSLAVLAVYAAQFVFLPGLYAKFTRAVYQQVIGKGDFGTGLVHRLYHFGGRLPLFHNLGFLTALHFSLTGLLVVALVRRWKEDAGHSIRHRWVAALLITAVIANPRMQYYDTCIAVLPAVYIFVEYLRRMRWSNASTASFAFGVTMLTVGFTTDYEVATCLLFTCAALLPLFTAGPVERLKTEDPANLPLTVAYQPAS